MSITVESVLSITVTPSTPRSYVDQPVEIHVTGDGNAVGPYDVTVDWGDGTVESYHEIEGYIDWVYTHTYRSAGTFTITVSVTDEYTLGSGEGSATQEIQPILAVSLIPDKTAGYAPLTVTFTCEARGGYLDYSWTLDPGDGSAPYSGTLTSEGTWTVTHTYESPGTFTAKLVVTDALGASSIIKVRLGAGVPAEVPWIRILGPAAIGGLSLLISKLA